MNTSKEYILMCQKALVGEEHNCGRFSPELRTWLPRQDQLQEMIIIENAKFPVYVLERKFNTFIDHIGEIYHPKIWQKFDSMEQLWLVFVMKEKFNKIWDGETWIEEKGQ
jgi:hypothetical protein